MQIEDALSLDSDVLTTSRPGIALETIDSASPAAEAIRLSLASGSDYRLTTVTPSPTAVPIET